MSKKSKKYKMSKKKLKNLVDFSKNYNADFHCIHQFTSKEIVEMFIKKNKI